MSEQLTLYSAKVCPFAHRVELALQEAKAEYDRFEIDLKNKPEWYAPKVNPASKVPAIAFGGPKVTPDQPSPESQKIAESLVLLEFVADLYPNSTLLPKDPVTRAKVRFFIDTVSTKVLPAFFAAVYQGKGSFDQLFEGFETVQKLLPANEKYAVGNEYTIADAALLPFLARMEIAISNDLGSYAVGEGKKAYETLKTDPKYARFYQYFLDLKARDSFKATFDAPLIEKDYAVRLPPLRPQVAAA